MKLVILESPFAGDKERNIAYAKRCMKNSLLRGEAPMVSHLLYTQVLNDNIPDEREMGIKAGLIWHDKAELCVVYIDLGISKGMQQGIDRAYANRIPVERRSVMDEFRFPE